MAEAVDDTLTPDDAGKVARELIEAQTESFALGLELEVPLSEVEAIHQQYQRPRDRLVRVIIEFLKRAEPRPTWRVIVEALKSPAVKLPALATKVEVTYLPDCTVTRVPTPTNSALAEAFVTATSEMEIGSDIESAANTDKPTSQLGLVPDGAAITALQEQIKGFHQRFNSMKESTIECLEKCRITVRTVVYLLTSVLAVGAYKEYLTEKHKVLRQSEDHWELFGELNLHWDYLSFDLLDKLLDEVVRKYDNFKTIKAQMETYKNDMKRFRESTTLVVFCQAVPHRYCDPPPGFEKMITKHQWPETVTLEDVEKFRKRFLFTMHLQECAMIMHDINRGSFIVTWFAVLPAFVYPFLKKGEGKVRLMLNAFQVISVEINGRFVFQTSKLSPSIPPHDTTKAYISVDETGSAYSSDSGVGSGYSSTGSGGSERLLVPVFPKGFTRTPQLTSKNPSIKASTQHALMKPPLPPKDSSLTTHPLLTGPPLPLKSSRPEAVLTIQCHVKKNAPCLMARGSATSDDQFAYFTPLGYNSVYQYEWSTEQWEELSSCPYLNSGLLVTNKKLVTVGGWERTNYTNKLFTLRWGKWGEEYPPMYTARSLPSVVSTADGEYFIVIGGSIAGGGSTTAAELLQVDGKRWYKLTDLPQPLHFPSASLLHNHLLHVIGSAGNGYSYSLKSWPTGDRPFPPHSMPHLISWKPLPPLPATDSTAATLFGQLVTVGGRDQNSIHQLVDGQWVKIGSMASDRGWAFVASQSPDKILIVGGVGAKGKGRLGIVEECVVVNHKP